MKINSRTILTDVKRSFYNMYGIELSQSQAGEVRDALRGGYGAFMSKGYVSTSSNDDIVRVYDRGGVGYSAYNTFYSVNEWNDKVLNGDFGKVGKKFSVVSVK